MEENWFMYRETFFSNLRLFTTINLHSSQKLYYSNDWNNYGDGLNQKTSPDEKINKSTIISRWRTKLKSMNTFNQIVSIFGSINSHTKFKMIHEMFIELLGFHKSNFFIFW